MTNPQEQQVQQEQVDLSKFIKTEEPPPEQPPPAPDFDEEAFANMVGEIAASVMASDLPSEYYAYLPSPKYLAQFYKIIQLKKASGYLYGAANMDPKTILIVAGVGTAAYLGWMGITAAKIKKQLGISGKRKAGEERKKEWEEFYKELERQKAEQEKQAGDQDGAQ